MNIERKEEAVKTVSEIRAGLQEIMDRLSQVQGVLEEHRSMERSLLAERDRLEGEIEDALDEEEGSTEE